MATRSVFDGRQHKVNQMLFESARTGDVRLAEHALRDHASVTVVNERSNLTALMTASYYGHIGVMHRIVDHIQNFGSKDDINFQNEFGTNAIMCAHLGHQPHAAEFLKSNGADEHAKDKLGVSANEIKEREEAQKHIVRSAALKSARREIDDELPVHSTIAA